MKRFLLILAMAVYCITLTDIRAQVSINYDSKTVAAMAATYATEAAAEAYYDEQVKAVLRHYNAAEVATAGIFTSKFLDRRGLTELGIWSSSTENYYYRRIYSLISSKIMPKIWTVAGLMLESPHTALYWGSYLMNICTEIKSLCMQFESVVTNGKLSFADIAFLEINPNIAPLFKLSESGGTDWKRLLDDLTKIPDNFTKENLQADMDNLYAMGSNLVQTGKENVKNTLMGESTFDELFQGKAEAVIRLLEGSYSLYEQLDRSVGNTLLQMVGGKENVGALLDLSNYNLTSWMTDYFNEAMGRYYTQRWYIARKDEGTEVLCDYHPPTDDESIINGTEWTRFSTSSLDFYPNSSQLEQILQNSESHAGWSRERVNRLNAANDGYTYSLSKQRYGYSINKGGKLVKKSYAYSIRVTRSWNREEVIYEEVFDSYSMDLNTFKSVLQSRLAEYNDNEDGYVYYIGNDIKQYYQTTDETRLEGCESVIISVTCSDAASLINGSTQYKCRGCGSSPNAHTKECAMLTTAAGNDLDLSELDALEKEYRQEIALREDRIKELETENASLIKEIADATLEEAAALRQQYNANRNHIDGLETEITQWKARLEELAEARTEAEGDDLTVTDDYYRIPAIMQDCKLAYDLTWNGDGRWSGYTYLREASAPGINGTVTFKATLTIARKQELMRQLVSATGHQQRLSREGMVMKGGKAPSEDALKYERLVTEVASGIKMRELGCAARLSESSMGMVDYWTRELKENPGLLDNLESDVNNALEVIRKAEKGERVEYASYRNRQQTEELREKQKPQVDARECAILIDIIRQGGMRIDDKNFKSAKEREEFMEKFCLTHYETQKNHALKQTADTDTDIVENAYTEALSYGAKIADACREYLPYEWNSKGNYLVTEILKGTPDTETREMVVVKDRETGIVDVVLPAGAKGGGKVVMADQSERPYWLTPDEVMTKEERTERQAQVVTNCIRGFSKQRIERALMNEGATYVRFFNKDGALGYRPDDGYFAGKEVYVGKLDGHKLVMSARYDVEDAVKMAGSVLFDRIQMIQDDNGRWALYIKPKDMDAFAIYPEKGDVNRFFSTIRQGQQVEGERVRVELAQKYHALATTHPELRADLFGKEAVKEDVARIQRVNIYKRKDDRIFCAPVIEGIDKVEPREISFWQYQRLWVSEDRVEYKAHLAAKLFSDVLHEHKAQDRESREESMKTEGAREAEEELSHYRR